MPQVDWPASAIYLDRFFRASTLCVPSIRSIDPRIMSHHDLLHRWHSWIQQGPFGHSRRPVGRGTFRAAGPSFGNDHSRVPHEDSPAGRRMMPAERERLLAQEAFEGLFTSLLHESHSHEMRRMAREILGADSFGLGACHGLVSDPAHQVSGLLQLAQIFLLADLHDQVCRPLSASSFMGTRAGTAPFTRGLFVVGEAEWVQRRLTKAHAKRELVYDELKSIMDNPAEFFEGLAGKVQQSSRAKWDRFAQRHQTTDPGSHFEAGKLFGALLLEVLLAIANFVAMTDAQVKLGAKAPLLLHTARTLKAGARTGGAAASEPNIVETAATPRRAKVLEGHWVEVLLADKRLGPLADETFDVTLPDGRKQRAITNQQGLCRIESIPAGSCRIQFRPAKGHLPKGADTEWNQLELGVTVSTDEKHKLEVDHNLAEIVEVDDAQFCTNSSVLVPVDAAQWGVHGLSIVAHALRYASENSKRTLMIVGHADNQEAARGALAAKRAKALEAILKGEAKAFVAACVDPNQAATPTLLDWASDRHGYRCAPKKQGPTKPEAGHDKVDPVQAALVRFRKEHNRREQTHLDEAAHGMVAADYEAFFRLYERTLADQLDVELSELSSVRSKLKFHSTPTLGAESEWPKPTGAGARQLRSRSSRRVDLMFLENDHPIPKLDDTAVTAEHFFVDERRVRRSYLSPRGAIVVVTPYTSADIDRGVDAAFKLVGPNYSSTIKLSERSKHAKDHFDVKYTELEFNLVPTEGKLKLSVTPDGGAESVLFENLFFAELLDDGAAGGR